MNFVIWWIGELVEWGFDTILIAFASGSLGYLIF